MMAKIKQSNFYVINTMWKAAPAFTCVDLVLCVLKSGLDAYTMVFAFRRVIQDFERKGDWGNTVLFLEL